MTKISAGSGPVDTHSQWLDHLKLGTAFLRRGEAVSAVAEFACALTLRPEDCGTRRQLAASLLRAGEPERALGLFDTLVANAPHGAEDLHGRGLALHALGLTAEAVSSFRAALAANPQSWRSAASIADISPDERERIAAIGSCADILAQLCESGGTPKLCELAAGALADAHRYLDLLDFCRRFFDDFENPARAYDWLAKASYELGRFGEALAYKHAALERTPLQEANTAQRPAFNPQLALEALDDVAEILTAQGLTVFPVAGTLLGLRRSGTPLLHDRDIDIGVFAVSGSGPDIAGVIRADRRLILPRNARPGDRYFALMHRGVAIDIFVHDVSASSVCCGFSRMPGDIQWRFSRFTLKEDVIGGQLWNLPHPADRYLAENYGDSWRTPDKGFASAVSSPALFGVDIRVRSFYAAARARNALLAGDAEKARALTSQSPLPLRLPTTG